MFDICFSAACDEVGVFSLLKSGLQARTAIQAKKKWHHNTINMMIRLNHYSNQICRKIPITN